MKTTLIVTLMSCALLGCGTLPLNCFGPDDAADSSLFDGVDPVLADYVELFERALQFDVMNVTMGFVDLDDGRAGVCAWNSYTSSNGRQIWAWREIRIDPTVWIGLTAAEKEALMFHELGHCVLNRDHNPARAEDGRPLSIMHPYLLDHDDYVKHHDYYVQELKEGK